MTELLCHFKYSEALQQQRGEALWEALRQRSEPMRPWSADDYGPAGASLREACDRGEDIFVLISGGELLLTPDFENGSLVGTIELDLKEPANSRELVSGLPSFLDSLFGSLRAPFAWADKGAAHPRGLSQAVLDTDLKWLFWLNYYGQLYIEKFGAAFFRAAPFYEVLDLPGKGLRCSLAPDPLSIETGRVKQITEYFQAAGLETKRYR